MYVLDGDIVRTGLGEDLGFSPADRTENIRRIGKVSKIMANAGVLVIVALHLPLPRRSRPRARGHAGRAIHRGVREHAAGGLRTADTKGLYAKARAGELTDFTSISSPYEEPFSPEMEVLTEGLSVEESVERILAVLA